LLAGAFFSIAYFARGSTQFPAMLAAAAVSISFICVVIDAQGTEKNNAGRTLENYVARITSLKWD